MTTLDAAGPRSVGVVDGVPRGLYIGGKWRDAAGGATFAVLDPSNRSELARVADGTVEDALDALTAATAATASWAATPPRARSTILATAYALMVERSDELALLMTLEMGKPLAESKSEVVYAAQFLQWFSEEAVRFGGTWRNSPDGASRLLTMRQPVGPSLFVTPWNFPLAMGTRKLGPALAAGCTTIIKPAALTPLSMLALAGILEEAGVPSGVVNVITTTNSRGVVSALLDDPRLRKISFTGSTPVGQDLVRQASKNLQRTSMELGGNAPFVVFADADIPHAIDEAVRAKLRNNGEACTAANRFYVHVDVVDTFVTGLAEKFAALVTGPGADPRTTIGPLIDDNAVLKCQELVDDAVSRGAGVVIGGKAHLEQGSFYDATILADVPIDARIMHEEVFGPVAPIATFATFDEVVGLANDTPYGLASYVFTANIDRALAFCEAVQAGMVGLNRGVLSNTAAPFGGIGASGFGREGGDEGIAEYLDLKYVAVDTARTRL
jgi:succinate-semialdehyde dehydrogenase/glutarate-semialdehyde dehydrogenase